jgi:phospholipase C
MRRRDAIKTLGGIAGAAGLSKLLPACGAEPGGLDPGIDTWVFMMLENRTYDHYLGARKLVEGLPGDGLVAGTTNPDLAGNDVALWPATEPTMCVIDPPHGWDASREQFNGGAMDGFVRAHESSSGSALEPMQYMLREHLPVTNALADAYASCDRWFASVMGPTLPNRMYWHAATSNGATNNDAIIAGAYEGVKTLYHNLDDKGVDWAYYYGDVPVLGVLDIPTEGRLRRFLYDFIDDAAAGRLPPVVYIDPAFGGNDDHPPHHPLLGQQLISAVYTALATSPQWERCMLVVTYDEHGGFYDHVPPPTAPDEFAAQGFDQLGFRVPTIAAGPYVKQRHVSSVVFDHTSALKHIEDTFGLAPLTARSSAATGLADLIDLERLAAGEPSAPIALPAVEIDETQLPAACTGAGPFSAPFEHDILAWAEAERARLGHLDRRHETADYIHGIADYLDRHGLGRIRRR